MTTPTLSEEIIQYPFDAQTWFAKELLAQVMFIVVLAKLIKNIIECIQFRKRFEVLSHGRFHRSIVAVPAGSHLL